MDIALWDIAGKVAGLPIHRLLGSYRDRVPAYANSAVLSSKEEYAAEAQSSVKGWKAYKIHPPTDPPSTSRFAARCAAPSGRLHRDARLDVGVSVSEALRVGRAIEELGFHWSRIRWPTTTSTTTSSSSSSSTSRSCHRVRPGRLHRLAPWLTARATDFLRGDVAVKGGISRWSSPLTSPRVPHQLRGAPRRHSLNNVANLHVIMAIKNCEFFEVLLPAAAQKYGSPRTSRSTAGDGLRAERPRPRRGDRLSPDRAKQDGGAS